MVRAYPTARRARGGRRLEAISRGHGVAAATDAGPGSRERPAQHERGDQGRGGRAAIRSDHPKLGSGLGGMASPVSVVLLLGAAYINMFAMYYFRKAA